ncbi:AIR synthase-related protein, partial [bacterium]|nr:AIR synthase-related protein [bacterium]
LGVSLCGGHAEITAGLTRPILVGQMLGEVSKDQLVIPEKIKPGDVILLTKGIAIEGTAILATEKENVLTDKMDINMIARAKSFLDDPGISIVKDALTVCQTAEIHGMHDPTEGGIMTGLWELAQVCNLGLYIERETISVFPETTAVCDILGLDPLGLIASGALLIVIDRKDADKVISSLSDERISCRIIGEILPSENRLYMHDRNKMILIKPFPRDEITKVLS